MQEDINSGKIIDTEIISHFQVRNELENRLKETKDKYSNNPSPRNEEKVKRAERDLNNAIRDGECLIKGTVPANCITK